MADEPIRVYLGTFIIHPRESCLPWDDGKFWCKCCFYFHFTEALERPERIYSYKHNFSNLLIVYGNREGKTEPELMTLKHTCTTQAVSVSLQKLVLTARGSRNELISFPKLMLEWIHEI